MLKVKVENMISPNGHKVPNQFKIWTNAGLFFQSYSTVIAFRPYDRLQARIDFKIGCDILPPKVYLDEQSWDYSNTTGKYRNIFLGETKKETEAKIKSGEYVLVNLN